MLLLRNKDQQWNNLLVSFATYPCWQSSGHKWIASWSSLYDTRTV